MFFWDASAWALCTFHLTQMIKFQSQDHFSMILPVDIVCVCMCLFARPIIHYYYFGCCLFVCLFTNMREYMKFNMVYLKYRSKPTEKHKKKIISHCYYKWFPIKYTQFSLSDDFFSLSLALLVQNEKRNETYAR